MRRKGRHTRRPARRRDREHCDPVLQKGDREHIGCVHRNGSYSAGKKKIRFTTCRKFKGLEADAVILADVDEESFFGNKGQNVLLYYVGTSRARLRLDILTTLDNNACLQVLEKLGKTDRVKRPQRDLARALNALPVMATAG